MKPLRPALDVSTLPEVTFGPRSVLWWGTVGFIMVEWMTLALCAASYLYLRKNFLEWPPERTPLPDLLLPTVHVLLMLASLWPIRQLDQAAKRLDRAATGRWLAVAVLLAVVFVVMRYFDFLALNTRWDSHAYGSVTWTILGFHASLLLLELAEIAAMAAVMYVGPVEGKHFSDASEGAFYWYFLVASWMPLYVLVYFMPRWT